MASSLEELEPAFPDFDEEQGLGAKAGAAEAVANPRKNYKGSYPSFGRK